MRFVEESGLWATGPAPAPVPLTAVLEVAGAVLSWSVDRPAADVHLAFTDPARPDWLWRVVGERGHDAIARALEAAAGDPVDIGDVTFDAAALEPLRRLALGHWLRRWWPASSRDGIAELDPAVLAGELALLTTAAEAYFADDTFDSDVAELLGPHVAMLNAHAALGDPRVGEIARACAELAEDIGAAGVVPVAPVRVGRRDDYALVAGADRTGPAASGIAAGVTSVSWAAVPAGIFDAAEDTVDWRVESDGAVVTVIVRAELAGPGSPAGIAVRVAAGDLSGSGLLDGTGSATIPLFDDRGAPVTESEAWGRDWRDTAVTVGAGVTETAQERERVRAMVRERLRRPGPDAFLAEILAAEADY